jgi:hypothetical protein
MTATIIVNGANATLNFAYTTTTTVALNVAGAAAEELYNRGLGNHGTELVPKLFSSYTSQEKVNLIDSYFLKVVNDLAKSFASNKAAEAARQTSLNDSATNLHL